MLTFTLKRHQPLIDTLNAHYRAGSMVTATVYTFGVDVSHWQGPINWSAIRAAGFRFAVIKATEGVAYTDPRMANFRTGAHAAGVVVLLYGYAGSSASRRVYAPLDEADYFARAVGPLAVGEGVALDYEPAVPPPDPPGWSRAWLARVRSVLAVPGPWIYMNRSTEARSNWSPLAADYGLWLAFYDNDPDPDAVVHWPNLTAEQYWDKATVPGIPGLVDVDVFYGPLSSLLAFCKQGSSPSEDPLSALSDTEQRQLLADTAFIADQLGGPGWRTGDWGWPTVRSAASVQEKLTAVDYLRVIDRQGNSAMDLTGRPAGDSDNDFGHMLSLRAVIRDRLDPPPVSADEVADRLAANPAFVTALAEQTAAKLDALLAERLKS